LMRNIKEKFVRIYVNCVKNTNLFEKKSWYLAHPLSFSRRVGPKDLKVDIYSFPAWYSALKEWCGAVG